LRRTCAGGPGGGRARRPNLRRIGGCRRRGRPVLGIADADFQTLALGGFWALLRAQNPEAVALMDPGLVEMCRRGETVTQEQYVEAVAQRVALGQRLRLFFDRYDLLLSPTMPIPAAFADPRTDELPNPGNAWSWVTYTYVFNLTKNPSCSIPCGFTDGLPIGLMVTGPLYEDLGVLQACRAYEEAAGPVWPSP